MTQARIEVNGVVGTDNDVPIATLVQLSNQDNGGETTYLWSILDQPEGTADALSSAAIENPTFTPNKEGTYLLQLIVNSGLSDERRDRVVVGVRQLKSYQRIPAALETTEDSTSTGWKVAVNRMLQKLDDTYGDANVIACKNISGGTLSAGVVVRFSTDGLIKTGLPGEERLVGVTTALATTPFHLTGVLGVVIGHPDGGAAVSANGVVLVRVFGQYENTAAGSPSVNDPVFVSNLGAPALTPGTYPRIIGRVTSVGGGAYRFVVEGHTGQVLPRVVNPALFETLDASWSIVNSSSDGLFWQTTGAIASGLVVPIPVNLGEVLYKLTMDLYQANTTSRITAQMFKARAFAGSGSSYPTQQSPATAGLQEFDYTAGAGSLSPVQLGLRESIYLHVIGSGGGVSSRNVGAVTAWVRPPTS